MRSGWFRSLRVIAGVLAIALSSLSYVNTPWAQSEVPPSEFLQAPGYQLTEQRLPTPVRTARVTNGSQVGIGQYPFLSAVLSARFATLEFDEHSVGAYYFGAGPQSGFSGGVVDCGLALAPCAGVGNRICAIVFDFPHPDATVLSPAKQLRHCSDGGGIGAVFRPNSENYVDRLDLADESAVIPAVYIYDRIGYIRWMTALANSEFSTRVVKQIPESILCGGSYLGNRWILTAAHCVYEQDQSGSRLLDPQELLVNVGAHDLSADSQFAQQVVEIVVGDYREIGAWGENDYALLRVGSDPLRGSPVSLVAEADLHRLTTSSAAALVLGWGRTQVREPLAVADPSEPTSTVPLAAVLKLVPVGSCRVLWENFFRRNGISSSGLNIRDIHLCAADIESQGDTCQGDSGGPILLDVDGELQLAGITNFGLGCGSKNSVPSVYASAPSFSDWVYRQTGLGEVGKDALANSAQFDPQLSLHNSSDIESGVGSVSRLQLVLLFLLAGLSRRRRRPAAACSCPVGTFPAVLLLCVALLAGCAGDSVTDTPDAQQLPINSAALVDRLERLDASYNGNDTLLLKVVSNGCTRAQHFFIRQQLNAAGECEISIKRRVPDLCKRATRVESISIPWATADECSDRRIVFKNPTLTDD